MKCPYCNEADTKVIDSRPADDNSSIRRRRQCERCGKRFTTYEKLETMPLMVIKKDDSREAYDRSKIEAGILHSCHKRPVSPRQISTMIDEIENQIFNREEKEIPTSVIGELTPCRVEEHAALLVLKHHMELVKEHMGALASFPVEGNAVEDGVGNDQQASGL